MRDYEQESVSEARELRDYEQVKCVRGAMNCATTNRKVCKRHYELRDYKQESVSEAL